MSKLDRVSLDGSTSSYVMFLLLDCVETLQMVAEKEFTAQGLGLKPSQKALLNSIKYAVKDLRKTTLLTNASSQQVFGDDADFMLKTIMLVVDRVGKDPERVEALMGLLCDMPSIMGLHLGKFGVRI